MQASRSQQQLDLRETPQASTVIAQHDTTEFVVKHLQHTLGVESEQHQEKLEGLRPVAPSRQGNRLPKQWVPQRLRKYVTPISYASRY